MSIKAISVSCPCCGASLDVEEGREQFYCSYCGKKILLDNSNEYIYRHIDEARVIEAETARMLKMKQLEHIEKNHQATAEGLPLLIKISIILGIIDVSMIAVAIIFGGDWWVLGIIAFCALLLIPGIWAGYFDDDNDLLYTVKVPDSVSTYSSKNYLTTKTIFEGAGFTNIKCVPLDDLTLGIPGIQGKVESIIIDGKCIDSNSGGEKFPADANVVITYHNVSKKTK